MDNDPTLIERVMIDSRDNVYLSGGVVGKLNWTDDPLKQATSRQVSQGGVLKNLVGGYIVNLGKLP